MRALTSRFLVLSLGVVVGVFAFTGVSLAQTSDPVALGAQSASPLDQGDVKGEFNSGNPANATEPAADTGAGSSLPSTDTAPAGHTAASLPFTGFLAIPVLLLGLAMLGSGIAMRRRATA